MTGDFIKSIATVNTGGGCMVDYLTLEDGTVLGVSDEAIALYRNQEDAENGSPVEDAGVIYRTNPKTNKTWNANP